MRFMASLGCAAALFLTACSQAPQAPAAANTAAATAPAASAAAHSTPADDPVVCCEFNGAKGSSTRSLCASYQGRVVPNDQCPGM